MKKSLAVAALVLAVACAGPGSSSPGTFDTGIEGIVTIGPTCPVESPDMRCDDEPYAAELFIVKRGSKILVERVLSAGDGRFGVAVPPGDYTVVPATRESGPPTAAPVDVTVKAHAIARVTIRFDSGIR